MRLFSCVLFLLSLTPRVGHASEVQQSAEELPPLPVRVVGEAFLGSTFATAGIVGGLMGGGAAERVLSGCDDCHDGMRTGMIVGAAALAPIGVYLGGRWTGAEGEFAPTLLGSVVAAGATSLLVSPLKRGPRGEWLTPRFVLATAAPLAGAIIGYEVSHSFAHRARQKRHVVNPELQLLPIVGISPEGAGVLGLVGRF